MVASRGLTAEQPEAGEVPAQCAALACEEGHQQAGDREGIADHRHGLAADAVHQCRQGGRQDEEPKEHHRGQETHGRLLRCGKFGGDTPRDRSHDIAEPHDKEAHKHGPENTFIYFVDTHRRRFFIHTIFQSYVFLAKRETSTRFFHPLLQLARPNRHGTASPYATESLLDFFTIQTSPATCVLSVFSYLCPQTKQIRQC